MAATPLRDLARGPLVLHGAPRADVERTHGRGGLDLAEPRSVHTGWGAEVAEEKLSSCRPGQRVRLEVLAHLEKVLEVACE